MKVQMLLKHWQAWSIEHLSRKPVPVFDCPLHKEMSTLNLPWHSFEPFPPILSLDYLGEELSSFLPTSPPQEEAESNEVVPYSPFFQTGEVQSPNPLLTGHSLEPINLHGLYSPPLDASRDLQVLLKLWGPELPTVLGMRLDQQWNNHLFRLIITSFGWFVILHVLIKNRWFQYRKSQANFNNIFTQYWILFCHTPSGETGSTCIDSCLINLQKYNR